MTSIQFKTIALSVGIAILIQAMAINLKLNCIIELLKGLKP